MESRPRSQEIEFPMIIAPAVPPAPMRPYSRLAPRTGKYSAVTIQNPEVSRRAPRAVHR